MEEAAGNGDRPEEEILPEEESSVPDQPDETQESHEARDMAPDEELEELEAPLEKLRIEDIRRVKLPITADLGRCDLNVREVLDLKPGSVLAMDKMAGEMADLYVGGVPLARGEVVVLGDTLHVRIAEVFGVADDEGDIVYEDE